MHIAFLAHYPELYGASRSLIDLIDGLAPHGVETSVIVPQPGALSDELARRDVAFRVLPVGRWVTPSARRRNRTDRAGRPARHVHAAAGCIRYNARVLPAIEKQLRAWNTDVVYSNSSVLLSGALVAARLRIPHVWHLREFGDLDYDLKPTFGRTAQRWFISRADGVIAVSNAVRVHFARGRRSRIRVVYNGIRWQADFDRLQRRTRRRRSSRDGTYTFAIVGLLHPAKGQESAIRALRHLVQAGRNARLVLAGTGSPDYEHELKTLAGRLDVHDRVEFRGYVNDAFAVYEEADAVLMCSRCEAMGRVTVEAMAASRPVIGFGGGGTREIVKHGSTGLLYDGDYEELASCMQQLSDHPDWGRRLGESGWAEARKLYSIERYAEGVLTVIAEVLSAGRNGAGRYSAGVCGVTP